MGSIATYLVVTACSGSGTAPSARADTDGSRLKIQHYVGSDGSSITAGLFDSALGVSCTYNVATDGSTRCLPAGGGFGPLIGGPPLFSDSACMSEILTTFPTVSGCPGGKYMWTTTGCAVEVYQPTPYTGILYTRGATGCVTAPSSALMGKTAYAQGNPVPPSSFVEGKLQTD
jgi:hypothetical protein